MNILTIIGARPQFIKAAAVSRSLALHAATEEIIVHTGQHYDPNMSDVFFSELEIPKPEYNLGIGSGTHGAMTGQMLAGIEEVIIRRKPDWLLVYGDTNSTLAGALAAAKLHVPVAHVEAGLRSFNKRMPEEINRIVTDHVSTTLLTPTELATKNLSLEGIPTHRVHQVGDVMYDATLFYASKAKEVSTILRTHNLDEGKYVLATIHRQENTDQPARLRTIVESLNEVARQWPVVLPLHPRTRKILSSANDLTLSKSILVLEPLGYLDMTMLECGAMAIATDSGGVQKEAFFHGVPCVTLRDETEWVELIESGWNRLAPPLQCDIAQVVLSAIGQRGEDGSPYGQGDAAKRTASILSAGA